MAGRLGELQVLRLVLVFAVTGMGPARLGWVELFCLFPAVVIIIIANYGISLVSQMEGKKVVAEKRRQPVVEVGQGAKGDAKHRLVDVKFSVLVRQRSPPAARPPFPLARFCRRINNLPHQLIAFIIIRKSLEICLFRRRITTFPYSINRISPVFPSQKLFAPKWVYRRFSEPDQFHSNC
jgi:hypothetical protein